MAKLYDLAEDLETAYNLLMETIDEETGEINPAAMEILQNCKEDFEEKISGLAEFIKRMTTDIGAYKAEEERLYKNRKALEKKIDWLKGYIKDNMIKANRDKVETTSSKVNLRTSHAVNILSIEEIPTEFKTVEQNIKVDKKAITDAFKNGQVVAGAEYVDNINVLIK